MAAIQKHYRPERPGPADRPVIYAQQPNGKWNRIEFLRPRSPATYDDAVAAAAATDYEGIAGHLATPRSQMKTASGSPCVRAATMDRTGRQGR